MVNKTSIDVGKKTMSLARLQQPESGVDLGEAYASTFSVSVSNVIRTNRNGGRSTSGANQHSNTVASDFSINIIAPGGSRGIKAAIPALKKAIEALEAEAEDEDNIDQESPLKLMDNAFLISTQKQLILTSLAQNVERRSLLMKPRPTKVLEIKFTKRNTTRSSKLVLVSIISLLFRYCVISCVLLCVIC